MPPRSGLSPPRPVPRSQTATGASPPNHLAGHAATGAAGRIRTPATAPLPPPRDLFPPSPRAAACPLRLSHSPPHLKHSPPPPLDSVATVPPAPRSGAHRLPRHRLRRLRHRDRAERLYSDRNELVFNLRIAGVRRRFRLPRALPELTATPYGSLVSSRFSSPSPLARPHFVACRRRRRSHGDLWVTCVPPSRSPHRVGLV